jgi:hypothetical protein
MLFFSATAGERVYSHKFLVLSFVTEQFVQWPN